MKFVIKYCRERVLYADVDNFNEASEVAKYEKEDGEVIMSVRSE